MSLPPVFTKNNVNIQTGANLHYQGIPLERFHVKAAASIVNKALECLISTHRQIKYQLHGKSLRYARRYFMFGPQGPDSMERNTMLAVITLTMNGIRSERTIVVDEHGFNPGAMGWTSSIHIPQDQLNNTKQQFPDRKFYFDGESDDYVMMGNITVSGGLLNAEKKQGVMTFIHEATHRYANTLDFDEPGYSNDGVTYNQPGLTTRQALSNAESYGWFAYKVGR